MTSMRYEIKNLKKHDIACLVTGEVGSVEKNLSYSLDCGNICKKLENQLTLCRVYKQQKRQLATNQIDQDQINVMALEL